MRVRIDSYTCCGACTKCIDKYELPTTKEELASGGWCLSLEEQDEHAGQIYQAIINCPNRSFYLEDQ